WHYLHAYINVSEGLGAAGDVLEVLGYEPPARPDSTLDKGSEKDASRGKSRKGFFKAFRRSPDEEGAASSYQREGQGRQRRHNSPRPSTGSSSLLDRPLPPLPPQLAGGDDLVALQTVYRRFILLKHDGGAGSAKAARLSISFASR